jgi:LytS/YehU family sensor histidine kinase
LPEAGNLVLKLKDTTKYMVYECDTALVPLQKEIKMIEDYLELEKVRYGIRLKN